MVWLYMMCAVCMVCKAWRHVALDMPELWSVVNLEKSPEVPYKLNNQKMTQLAQKGYLQQVRDEQARFFLALFTHQLRLVMLEKKTIVQLARKDICNR